MKPVTLNFRYRNANQYDPYAERLFSAGRRIPATLFVVMVAVELDAEGGILRTDVLPTIYESYAEAREYADKLPSATGVLTLAAEVMAAKALVQEPQIL
jgi:hypothetical protein